LQLLVHIILMYLHPHIVLHALHASPLSPHHNLVDIAFVLGVADL
jgi:hypothetical protein